MHPSMRQTWAANWARLVRPGGTLVTLIFPVVPEGSIQEGPPFPGLSRLHQRHQRPFLEPAAICVLLMLGGHGRLCPSCPCHLVVSIPMLDALLL